MCLNCCMNQISTFLYLPLIEDKTPTYKFHRSPSQSLPYFFSPLQHLRIIYLRTKILALLTSVMELKTQRVSPSSWELPDPEQRKGCTDSSTLTAQDTGGRERGPRRPAVEATAEGAVSEPGAETCWRA